MQIEGKVALVTGAAHRVGKAIALALAQEGAHLIVHYGGSADAAAHTVDEIKALGVDAVAIQADLRRTEAIDALFAQAQAHFDRLDILVNSAASFVKQPFDDVSLDDWKDVMQVNLRSPFLLTQQAARWMRHTQRPADQPAAIVNIVDHSGVVAWGGFVQHGVSKAGLIHLTKVSARELGPEIRVNAVLPGAVLPPPDLATDSDRWQRMGEPLPLKRTGHPFYVGETVVFLARNDYITGVTIPVDGGEHMLGPSH